MKKILILGSSGLVGSATKEILTLEDSFKVLSPLRKEVDLFSPLEISQFIDENENDAYDSGEIYAMSSEGYDEAGGQEHTARCF